MGPGMCAVNYSSSQFLGILTIFGTCLVLASYIPSAIGETACELHLSVPLEGGIDDDLNFVTNEGLVYRSGNYWVDGHTFRGCICTVRSCVQKCCPIGFFTDNKMDCVPKNESTPGVVDVLPTFTVYTEDDDDYLELVKGLPANHFHVIPSMNENFTCDAYVLEKYELDDFALLKDGQLKIPLPENVPNGIDHYRPDQFCMEVNSTTGAMVPYVCFAPENDHKEALEIYPYFLVVSIFFLIITLIVYIILPPLRNNPGKCMMNMVACLIIGYCFLAHQQFSKTILPRRVCRFIAYTIYFFLMASYFWLNVMCYDIYSAFKAMQNIHRSNSKKKFIMYSCYAWGSPMIMFLFAYFVDMYGPKFILKPQMAVTSCWFGQTSSLYMYFYGPMMILLGANIYFFAVTIYKLHQVSKQTEVLRNAESQRHHQKEKDRCYLYGKLFVVMGVTWIMEVVSERIGGKEYFWYPTDIINICQGISIFVIFVLKRRVLYMLNQKFCPSLNLINASEAASSKPNTSSTASSGQNGNALNGAALNGNGRRPVAPNTSLNVEDGYENPIPMTPLASRVETNEATTRGNGDVAVPIDDTVNRRY